MESGSLRGLCKVMAGLSIAAGVVGMAMSFLYLASKTMADITAGTSGFIAGAILIGSGLIALSLLVSSESTQAATPLPATDEPDYRITR